MKNELYPIKFKPILKEKVWGGTKLKDILQKNTVSNKTGESWEISDIEEDVSVVSEGSLSGKTLREIITLYKEDLVGEKDYHSFQHTFPLLFKFIDAYQNLSPQLHPDNKTALKRHNSFGKTEMWYVLQADKDAGMYIGFKNGSTLDDYLNHLKKGTLEQIMNFIKVKPGDVFNIKPGLVHSIGKGILLAEIQQSSDITYRIFDWNRKDFNGKPRKLHTDLALDVIDFEFDEFQISYPKTHNRFQTLVENEFFKTRIIHVRENISLDYPSKSSFIVFMCVSGKAEIHSHNFTASLNKGETVFIPACLTNVEIHSQQADLLEVRV